MNLLTPKEEIELLQELESFRKQVDLLQNGVSKWKLKIVGEHNDRLDKTLNMLRKRYRFMNKMQKAS